MAHCPKDLDLSKLYPLSVPAKDSPNGLSRDQHASLKRNVWSQPRPQGLGGRWRHHFDEAGLCHGVFTDRSFFFFFDRF